MNALKRTGLLSALLLSLAVAAPTIASVGDTKSAERSAGQVIDDATITASVKTALLADGRTKAFDINVDTLKGKVTLKGGADNLSARNAATEVARNVKGVQSVDNQLVVAAAGSETRQQANRATASGEVRNALDETGDAVDDGWITSKVKTQLLADRDVSGLAINVSTSANVVSLKGNVPNTQARATAIRIASQTKGVKSVNADQLVVSAN